jgi:hypothetical protein
MTTLKTGKRLTLIELNEFSLALLSQGVKELHLPNVERLLALRSSATTTDDMVEHRGLDPWVQWVSVHTGVPSSVHGVIHLGDAPANLEFKQLWETLSDAGISSGIWGAMNAMRGNADECLFFLPDPWTFGERATPENLNELLALPRYYSTNYLEVSRWEFFKCTMLLTKFLLGSGALTKILAQSPLVLGGLWKNGLNNEVLFSLFDLFSAAIFAKYKKRYRPQFSVIFLNSIAHLQHHGWHADQKISGNMAFGLKAIDRVLETLFNSLEDGEACIVMNALTQKNISTEKPRICYRQISPSRFLESIGFQFESVKQLMTNDAHVFFATESARDFAAEALECVTINGAPLFQVERNIDSPCRLFYQVDFWDELAGDIEISINGQTVNFLGHFEAIIARTGAHLRNGDVFFQGIDLPQQMYNHKIAEYVLSFFNDMNDSNGSVRESSDTVAAHAA